MENMHWVYHPTEAAKIVHTSEYNVLLKSGWYDTPAKFQKSDEVLPEVAEEKIEETVELPDEGSLKEDSPKRRGRPAKTVVE